MRGEPAKMAANSPKFRPLAVSAPSKLILHGEHAVVYGKTAIAGSLDLRTRMEISPATSEVIEIDFPDIGVKQAWTVDEVRRQIFSKKPKVRPPGQVPVKVDAHFLKVIHNFLEVDEDNLKMASLICFFYLYSVVSKEVVPMRIRIDSDIPIGAGLGSSAALSVCLATGLLSIARPETFNLCEATKDEISRLAFLSEKILHGTPSGVDNSVSSYGGMIEFANGVVTLLEAVPRLRILLVNTNVSRNTKHVIEKVRDQFIAMPRVVKAVMDAIDGVSHNWSYRFTDATFRTHHLPNVGANGSTNVFPYRVSNHQ